MSCVDLMERKRRMLGLQLTTMHWTSRTRYVGNHPFSGSIQNIFFAIRLASFKCSLGVIA